METKFMGKQINIFDGSEFGQNDGYYYQIDFDAPHGPFRDEQLALDDAKYYIRSRQAASILGKRGGQSRSMAKQKASRANGKRGGRPAKTQPTLRAGDTATPSDDVDNLHK